MEQQHPTENRTIYTIGHSNHPESLLVELLQQHEIDVLVDVRSQPYSRYTVQFNREPLSETLKRAGVRYLFLGEELGGRPEGAEYYDDEGHVLYAEVARSAPFLEGILRLIDGSGKHRVCLMCSEEDPTVCHRYLLVGRVLAERGVALLHIRKDGGVQTDDDLDRQQNPGGRQRLLFEPLAGVPEKSMANGSDGSRIPRSG